MSTAVSRQTRMEAIAVRASRFHPTGEELLLIARLVAASGERFTNVVAWASAAQQFYGENTHSVSSTVYRIIAFLHLQEELRKFKLFAPATIWNDPLHRRLVEAIARCPLHANKSLLPTFETEEFRTFLLDGDSSLP